MRFKIEEITDGVGNKHFVAATFDRDPFSFFGKKKWGYEATWSAPYIQRIQEFKSVDDAFNHLKEKYIRVQRIVLEGDL